MKDSYGRHIDYMRISITDRCNLRCNYCIPQEGVDSFDLNEILTNQEITKVCEIAARLGISKIRLTGGEPLVRDDVAQLVGMLHDIDGIEEVNLTTNGILLKEKLDELIENGINSINISLDTANPQRFREITGRDEYSRVFDAVTTSITAGVKTKINSVLLNHEDYKTMINLAKEYPLTIRFIELMPIGAARNLMGASFEEVLEYIDDNYPGRSWDDIELGNGPARYISIPGFEGHIGLISPMHGKFCDRCNRIRMTATGLIKPCLCYGQTYDIKTPVRNGEYDRVEEVLRASVFNKPKEHSFENISRVSENNKMVSIGG